MRRRRVTMRLTLLVVATVLASACTTFAGEVATSITTTTATTTTTADRPSTSPPAASSSGFLPETIVWESCGQRLQCATLKVPLDYADPTGPTIELSLNELPARRQGERIGTLLINPGGPGASGLDFVASGVDLPAELLDRFDIVGFDPRGVGASTPLLCGDSTVPPFRKADSTPDSPDEQATLDAAARNIADECATHAGEVLPHLGTDDVVRDMNTIRQALGENQINYLGLSYGTLLGLRFAQLFPRQARAIALDGVVDPAQDFRAYLRQQTIAFEREVTAIFDACPADGPDCPPGGAAAAYDELARRVESAPIAGSDGKTLGPSELADAALIVSYEPSAVPVFYRSLDKALEGDGTPLLRFASAFEDSVKYTVYAAVECTDSPHPVGRDEYIAFAEELEALSPRFGGTVANELLPCAYWPAPVDSIIGPITAPGAPPILVIGTTGDPATPYEQAVTVAKTLQNGRLLTFTGEGHAAYGKSTCIDDAEAAYFVDLSLPPEGTNCSN